MASATAMRYNTHSPSSLAATNPAGSSILSHDNPPLTPNTKADIAAMIARSLPPAQQQPILQTPRFESVQMKTTMTDMDVGMPTRPLLPLSPAPPSLPPKDSLGPGGSEMTTEDSSTMVVSKEAPVKRPPKSADPKPEVRKVRFSVGTNYAVQDVIGEGAYGIVCSAVHRVTGQKVAIKKIAPFDHSMFALRTLRELKLLRYFAEQNVSENIISIVDIIKPSSYDTFKEVYLIQELMETDLHRVIRSQPLSDDHCQYFVYQTLRAIKALHSADVIHRDLKPSNLLLNANCDLKVCDFGLARSTQTAEPNGGETGFMTEYVATRWYRAPEIMLTFKQYTKAIDIWSVGCILAEMLSGRPLFPGRDYHHQLTLILDVLGTPTTEEFYGISSRRSRDYLRAVPLRKKRDFKVLYPNASEQAIDFLERSLTFDPKKRITVEQALAHPYLANYHDPDDEPVAPPLESDFFEFDLEKDSISKEKLKRLLYEEVMQFKLNQGMDVVM